MTRLYGRALLGKRIVDYVPDVRFERTSIIGALGSNGIIAPFVYKGNLNGELFKAYVETFLAPSMKSGDILVLDNLSAHKVKDALASLESKGILIKFLPAYSPDLNPIELAWSKIKSYLRKTKARTYDSLEIDIKHALLSITSADCYGWITHCGYRTCKD